MSTCTVFRVENHEAFIVDQLLPLIVGYARTSNTPSEVVARACFLSLATILQAKGLPRDELIRAVDTARLPIYPAPDKLQ